MKCHVCGSKMKSMVTDLPLKTNGSTIVILKELPVYQCESCTQYLLEDAVMNRVDEILEKVDVAAELEVVRYAA